MQIVKKSKRIQKYLELMAVLPPVSPELMQTANLMYLRRLAPQKLTQADVARALGCNRSTVSDWERGLWLTGISYKQILIMADLFNRHVDEVIAAIANTQLLTEEEPPDLPNTN